MKQSELKAQKLQAILLLRFHKVTPKCGESVYLTYAEIARRLGLSYHTVKDHCARAVRGAKHSRNIGKTFAQHSETFK